MDKQETFNRVVRHLLTQGKKAIYEAEDGPACAYRGADGTKCAIGCLIPDSFYLPVFEGNAPGLDKYASTVGKMLAVAAGAESQEDVNLLRELQHVHDTEDPELWPGRLRRVAADYGLTTEVVDSFNPAT